MLKSITAISNSVKPIHASLKDYAEGIIGRALFSLSMLYINELWWAGFLATPVWLLIYILVGISLLMAYNHYVGIRRPHFLGEFH